MIPGDHWVIENDCTFGIPPDSNRSLCQTLCGRSRSFSAISRPGNRNRPSQQDLVLRYHPLRLARRERAAIKPGSALRAKVLDGEALIVLSQQAVLWRNTSLFHYDITLRVASEDPHTNRARSFSVH